MKNKVTSFTLILLFFIPVSFVSAQHPAKGFNLERNVILELARLYSTSIRSTNSSVVASKAHNMPHIYVEFGFEGQFEIIISNHQTEFYNNTISILLSPNMKNEKLSIPISNLKTGDYIFTIKDLSNQKSSSGKFVIM